MHKTRYSGPEAATIGQSRKQPSRVLVETAIVFITLLVAFWPILVNLFGSWFDESEYMEHGLLVIPAAAYMVWSKAPRLAAVQLRPSKWGFFLVVCGALQALVGIAAHWAWVSRAAFLVALTGCILALYGAQVVRELAYPLGTLVLMVPPPSFLYDRLTFDLQLLASRLGETFLEAFGYSVMREGNVLHLVGITLSVEQACSGIRSLFSILFMCSLYNYLFVHSNTTRAIIFLFSVPIAILGNAGRIVATGIVSQYSPAWTEGARHELFGYISIVVAAIGCIILHLAILEIKKWRHNEDARNA